MRVLLADRVRWFEWLEWLGVVGVVGLLAVFPVAAQAQAIPGTPTGSQTGDGGGAFTGLASSPEANLFTGVAQTSIPIGVPPGRLGLAPVLALSYSSSSGPSHYGHGWALPIARIHRSTRDGVPDFAPTDTFVLEMPGVVVELEPIPGSPSGYRAQTESAFLRIGFDDNGNSWKVIDKLGVTFLFGRSSSTRTGRGPERNDTFAWLLERVEDPAGNRIDFEYEPGGSGGTSRGLPRRIQYGANTRSNLPHFAEVAFTWEDILHPAPPRRSWREGHEEVYDVRLAAIDTRTHDLAARRYDFSHEEDPVTFDLRLIGVTLTAFAEGTDDDVQLPSTVFVYAPALHKGWPALGEETGGAEPYEIPGVGLLREGRRTVLGDTLDLNGDSIPDRIDTGPRPPQVSLGTGRSFEPAGSWNWPGGDTSSRTIRTSDGDGNLLSNVFDLDGDGFADFVDSDARACSVADGFWCVWRGSAEGFATAATSWPSPWGRLRNTASGGTKVLVDLIDLDGDGRPDLVDSTRHDGPTGLGYWEVYFNTGQGFDAVPRPFAAPLPSLSRTIGGRLLHGLFDINADSLPDLVAADVYDADGDLRWSGQSSWQVYLNDGRGLSAEPTVWPIDQGAGDSIGLPNFLSLRASDGTTIADLFDITGDGRPDLVRRTRTLEPLYSDPPSLCRKRSSCADPDEDESAISRVQCCFNLLVFVNTGSSFSQPVAWSSPAHGLRADFDTCPYEHEHSCTWTMIYDFDFFDVDGDGLVDFVQRSNLSPVPGTWLVHPHPASATGGGARPNLLLSMRNGVGGESMLRYTTASSAPDTSLPFPHWMVHERELRDSIYDQAPLRTTFAYRGGFFDRLDREMRGFALVQQVDPQGRATVTEYHQDRRRSGRIRRRTSLPPPSCPLSDPEDPEDPCSPWRVPLGTVEYDWSPDGPVQLTRESDVPWHLGQPVENLRRTTRYLYDEFGNIVQRRVETPMAATTETTTEYAYRVLDGPGGLPATYSVAKPSKSLTREEGREAPLVERRFEYEWTSPAPASLLADSSCMEWQDGACTRWSRRSFSHDRSGNVVVSRTAGGSVSRTRYDSNALFAVEAVDPVGLKTTSETDPRTGQVTETVAPGGNRLRSKYDGLGRLLRTWGPGTSKAQPLRRYEYAPGSLGDQPPRIVVTDAESGATATFFDGLGRKVADQATRTREDGTAVAVVSGLQVFDEQGRVTAEALPFESDALDVAELGVTFEDATAWLEFEYDEAGRLTQSRAPDGATTRLDRSTPGILRRDDANLLGGRHPGAVTLEVFDGLDHRILRDSCSEPPTPQAPYECPQGSLLRREHWTWDGLGRVVETRTEALGVAAADSVVRIERDGLGNRRQVFHSDAGTWRFLHDVDGRVVEVLKPDGIRLKTSYDRGGRLRRRRGPTSRARYVYHRRGGGLGKVRRVVSRSGDVRSREAFEYDERGRVATRQRRVSVRRTGSARLTVAYHYDDLDRRIATEFPDWSGGEGDTLRFEYDAQGREIAVSTVDFRFVDRAAHDSMGRLRRVDFGHGLSELFGFDSYDQGLGTTGQLRCMRTAGTDQVLDGACAFSPDDLDALRYAAYDALGNLLVVEDPLHLRSDSRHSGREYQYDALGRLSVESAANRPDTAFEFDPLGNLRRKGDLELRYDDPEHPGRITRRLGVGPQGNLDDALFEHDTNGRRTRDGRRTFLYDEWDRLVEVRRDDGPVARYGYDDTGALVVREDLVAGSAEFEMGDGVRLTDGLVERTITFQGRSIAVERWPVRRRKAGRTATAVDDLTTGDVERIFLHHDHQLSLRTVTDTTGHVLESRRYSPFGQTRTLVDGTGRVLDRTMARTGYTGQVEEAPSELLFFGARHYDPRTGSFLTLDPSMQFASPYAYSAGNPVLGRDPDGRLWQWTALEILAAGIGAAAFIDTIVSTGDLGHSLTAGVFAGLSVYLSGQLSTAVARPFATGSHPWLQMTASVASQGFQAMETLEAIEDGRYAGGVVAAGMLAASLIGIESAGDPGSGTTREEIQDRHGIQDRGVINGRRTYDVDGICATRPGCVTNTVLALRENLRSLFTGQVGCVGGCDHVATATGDALKEGQNVLLRCNSFGSIKCLGAIQNRGLAAQLSAVDSEGLPRLAVEMSGAPLLRPPVLESVTYQVNLFDPVVWAGTAYSTPFRSDVGVGRNWWVPAPVLVHHTSMYEKPFHRALADLLP